MDATEATHSPFVGARYAYNLIAWYHCLYPQCLQSRSVSF